MEHNSGNRITTEEIQTESTKIPEMNSQKTEFPPTEKYQEELKPNQSQTTEKYLEIKNQEMSLNKSQMLSISNQSASGINVLDTLLPKPVIPLETESPIVLQSKDPAQTDDSDNGVIPSISPETTTETMFQTTLNIETSSSVQLIENTQIVTEAHPTIIPLEEHSQFSTIIPSVLNLEPSRIIEDDAEIKSTSTIPMEGLIKSITKMEVPLRTQIHPLYSAPTTNFFTKSLGIY